MQITISIHAIPSLATLAQHGTTTWPLLSVHVQPVREFLSHIFTRHVVSWKRMETIHLEKVAESQGYVCLILFDQFFHQSFIFFQSAASLSHSAVRSLQDSMVKPAPLRPELFQLAEPARQQRQELPNTNLGITN